MTSPPSLQMLCVMAVGPADAGALSGEKWHERQRIQLWERSSLVEGDPLIVVSLILKREII